MPGLHMRGKWYRQTALTKRLFLISAAVTVVAATPKAAESNDESCTRRKAGHVHAIVDKTLATG